MIALIDLIIFALVVAAVAGGGGLLRKVLAGGLSTARRPGLEGGAAPAEIAELRARVESLESRLAERDRAVEALREELSFVSRVLEGPGQGSGRTPPPS